MTQYQHAATDIYISHSPQNHSHLTWFIVQPTSEQTVEDEVQDLIAEGRTVYQISAKPNMARRLMSETPIRLKPTGLAQRPAAKVQAVTPLHPTPKNDHVRT